MPSPRRKASTVPSVTTGIGARFPARWVCGPASAQAAHPGIARLHTRVCPGLLHHSESLWPTLSAHPPRPAYSYSNIHENGTTGRNNAGADTFTTPRRSITDRTSTNNAPAGAIPASNTTPSTSTKPGSPPNSYPTR